MFHFSIHFKAILIVEGTERAIECNWEVNRAFGKFGRGIEKGMIVEGGKV